MLYDRRNKLKEQLEMNNSSSPFVRGSYYCFLCHYNTSDPSALFSNSNCGFLSTAHFQVAAYTLLYWLVLLLGNSVELGALKMFSYPHFQFYSTKELSVVSAEWIPCIYIIIKAIKCKTKKIHFRSFRNRSVFFCQM